MKRFLQISFSVAMFIACSTLAFAILRPLYPSKPHAPRRGEVITIEDDSIQTPAQDTDPADAQ